MVVKRARYESRGTARGAAPVASAQSERTATPRPSRWPARRATAYRGRVPIEVEHEAAPVVHLATFRARAEGAHVGGEGRGAAPASPRSGPSL